MKSQSSKHGRMGARNQHVLCAILTSYLSDMDNIAGVVLVIRAKPIKAQWQVPPFSQAQSRSQAYKSSRVVSAMEKIIKKNI